MGLLGRAVRFVLCESLSGYGVEVVRRAVTGTIVFVNEKHKWFSVEYGDLKMRTSFRFSQIGENVKVVG